MGEGEHGRSAERRYWLALVDRVFGSPRGLAGLSQPEQTYYAVSCLMGEVYNGGFGQFFSNSSGELYALALDGLVELGAVESASLLIQAKEVFFGDGLVPLDRGRRLELMPTTDDESHPTWQQLDALDKKFYEDPDRLAEKRRAYAISRDLYEGG